MNLWYNMFMSSSDVAGDRMMSLMFDTRFDIRHNPRRHPCARAFRFNIIFDYYFPTVAGARPGCLAPPSSVAIRRDCFPTVRCRVFASQCASVREPSAPNRRRARWRRRRHNTQLQPPPGAPARGGVPDRLLPMIAWISGDYAAGGE